MVANAKKRNSQTTYLPSKHLVELDIYSILVLRNEKCVKVEIHIYNIFNGMILMW